MPKTILILVIIFFSAPVSGAETLYIRSVKAQAKELPLFSSASIAVFRQGQKVELLERKGSWVFVASHGMKGWVSVFFTSSTPPLKAKPAVLLRNSEVDLTGKGRRRASAYTTSAAARGLVEERARKGRRRYHPDFFSLAIVDSYVFSEQEVSGFLKKGGLK